MNFNLPPAFAGLATFIGFITMLLGLAIHISFAIGVLFDGNRLERQGKLTRLAPAFIWMLATLIGGVFVAGLYWFLHHSTIFEENKTNQA